TAKISGRSVAGAAGVNYTLGSTTATATASITVATVTAAVTAANKPYDNTTSATLTSCTLTGVIGGDVVSCTGTTAAFASATVGRSEERRVGRERRSGG